MARTCAGPRSKIANEDRLALLVTPGAGRLPIAERAEQCLQLVGLPVDVPDDVVGHDRHHYKACSGAVVSRL